MTYHIAVIGAGQLGSRHLQGLRGLAVPATLYMVDPAEASLATARQRFDELAPNENIRGLFALRTIDELPAELDLLISATTADVRLASLQQLLSRCAVRYAVLEKVLFQRAEDYGTAGALLDRHGVRTWVNCPRRCYPIYQTVRDFFKDSSLRLLQVDGGGWGLGCNAVHFADLFTFLTGTVVRTFDDSKLERTVYPSKRPTFVEFGGSLEGHEGRVRVSLASAPDGHARSLVVLRADDRSCIIDEHAGRASFLLEDEGWRDDSFEVPYQSQLTGSLAQSILASGSCALPDFSLAVEVHLPVLAALARHYRNVVDPRATACPVT